MHCQGITQLVLIYQPWRDGRLSRSWCEVAPGEIRTCNLPIANPALYHTAKISAVYARKLVMYQYVVQRNYIHQPVVG